VVRGWRRKPVRMTNGGGGGGGADDLTALS